MNEWHVLDKKEALKELNSNENGISEHEAAIRLKKHGKNELRQTSKLNPLLIFLEQFKSVFILILFLAALFSLFIRHYIDFAVVFIIILLNSIIGFLQQYKAEKAIAALKNMLVPNVKVIRNGKMTEISSLAIVPGDILEISEGDKIMADCRIIHTNELEANEAILTGESFPQRKSSIPLKEETELADRENMLYMGTLVARGSAKAVVVATGMNTEFGRIAGLVQTSKTEETPLERKLNDFSKKVAVVVLVLAALIIGLGIAQEKDTYDMILTGISLAVSVIPEGIPAVIAITLALAIGRMQKNNALIRKLPAAETLGRTTVICTDKTGTLTEEEMTVTKLYCNNSMIELKEKHFLKDGRKINPLNLKELSQVLKIGILCNNARIEKEGRKVQVFGDSTEKALVISAEKAGLMKKYETERETRVIEYSFSSRRKLMSIVRKNNELVSYVKGAPDTLLRYCDRELVSGKIVKLTSKRKSELHSMYESMASEALRVLGFAYKPLGKKFDQNTSESDLIFAGFQGMLDPPRKEVKSSILHCKEAGIKVKMITGDSLLTANAVSEMIGLEGESIESKNLEKLSDNDFDRCVLSHTIFARVTPELKLKIVQSLKKQGEIVAVTGDGVNDVLALKEAHIGVAMGVRGTDVSREVSDIVLMDDNFSSIVKAVREGRRVYDNLKKSIKFHLAANVGEMLVVLISLLVSLPIPFLPLAILWMNLVTDSLPSLALSIEKEEENIMRRKPMKSNEDILDNIMGFMFAAGVIASIASLALFLVYYQTDLAKARTMALTTAVFCELFLVSTCRSDKNIWKIGIFSNKAVIYSIIIAFALQITAIYTPLASVFEFSRLSIPELLLTIAVASTSLIFFEITKMIKTKMNSKSQ